MSDEVLQAAGIKLAELTYDDALKPWARALGGLGSIVAFPFEWTRIKLDGVLERLRQRVPENKLVEPPKIVGVPLLQALPAAQDEPDLTALYEELLAKAMHADHRNDVHPAYVKIVGELSPDEARLLSGFWHAESGTPVAAPRLVAQAYEPQEIPDIRKNPDQFLADMERARTGTVAILGEIEVVQTLAGHLPPVRSDAVAMYLRNMARLGLIEARDRVYTDPLYDAVRESAGEWRERHAKFDLDETRSVLEVTPFGVGFLRAVLSSTPGVPEGQTYVLHRRDHQPADAEATAGAT